MIETSAERCPMENRTTMSASRRNYPLCWFLRNIKSAAVGGGGCRLVVALKVCFCVGRSCLCFVVGDVAVVFAAVVVILLVIVGNLVANFVLALFRVLL